MLLPYAGQNGHTLVKSLKTHLKKILPSNPSNVKALAVPLDETHLDAVRGLIKQRGFHFSASTSGARRSDAATSGKDKQICFMLIPST